MKTTIIVVLLALSLVGAVSLSADFFDERFIQVLGGVSYIPTQTMVVVGIITSEELPEYEFIDRHVLGPSLHLIAPVRDWVKIGAQLAWAADEFDYEEPGRMNSQFSLSMTAYQMLFYASFSLYQNDFLDVTFSPGFATFGAAHRPEDIRAWGETTTTVGFRASADWKGSGFTGALGLTFNLGGFLLKLDGGWLVGGIDVSRKLFIEGDGYRKSDIYLDPSSTISNFHASFSLGYFF